MSRFLVLCLFCLFWLQAKAVPVTEWGRPIPLSQDVTLSTSDFSGRSLKHLGVRDEWAVGMPGFDQASCSTGSVGCDVGRVLIGRHVAGQWSTVQTLVGFGGSFGSDIAVDATNRWLAVGAPSYENTSGVVTGAVYIYEYMSTQWVFKERLEPATGSSAQAGAKLLFSGSSLFIGAPFDNLMDISVGGNIRSLGTGSVFEFQLGVDESWGQVQRILPSSTHFLELALFGSSIELSDDGNWLFVGAPDSPTDNERGDRVLASGATYLYEKESGSWVLRQVLREPELRALDRYGTHVAYYAGELFISSETVAIDQGASSGAIFGYQLNAGTWERAFHITVPNRLIGHGFGADFDFYSDQLFVGASNRFNSCNQDCGNAVYRFAKENDVWQEQQRIDLNINGAHVHFGEDIEVSNDLWGVASYLENSNAGEIRFYQPVYQANLNADVRVIVQPGQVFQYELTVNNNDEFRALEDLDIEVSIPVDVTVRSVPNGCITNSSVIQCEDFQVNTQSDQTLSFDLFTSQARVGDESIVSRITSGQLFSGQQNESVSSLLRINSKPEFASSVVAFTISSNVVNGAVVGRVQATDVDDDTIVNYGIIENTTLFDIDAAGVITVARSSALLSQSNSVFEVNVIASDGKVSSDPQRVQITVVEAGSDSSSRIGITFVWVLLMLSFVRGVRSRYIKE